MTEARQAFFASLPRRAPQLLPGPIDGTLQIDLVDGNRTEHWRLTMRTGEVVVSQEPGPAEAVFRTSMAFFDKLATGEAQLLSGALRNELTIQGRALLLLALRRFFPDPPGTRDPRRSAQERVRPPSMKDPG